ncbi:MAG: T9SS type A sorting domain-containing protein [Calditrichia bacterium]
MKTIFTSLMVLMLSAALSAQVYINEVDYDQPGTDEAEFVELVGPDGTDLSGYTLELVNGNNGSIYNTVDLAGQTIPSDNESGFGFLVIGSTNVANVDFTPSGWIANAVQNGSPDGILLKLNGTVVDGISYEGVLGNNPDFTAGMAITAEDFSDNSVGRVANGFDSGNQDQYFAVDVAAISPGAINAAHGQVLGGDPPPLISGITRMPFVPLASENVTVSATVTDDSDVTAVQLRYTINSGSEQQVAMTEISTDNYAAEIAASEYTDSDLVSYKVYAEDDAPQSNESPSFGFLAGTTPIGTAMDDDSDGNLIYLGLSARLTGVLTVATGVFSATNVDVYMQDATGGTNVFAFGLDSTFSMTRGNSYTVIGTIAQFNGKGEIIPNDLTADIIDNGAATEPGPVTATLADLNGGNSEGLEGQLVAIAGVTNTGAADPWPAVDNNANVEITDDGGTNVYTLRVDSDTDIDGSAEPAWPVNVQGILTQFDNSPPYTEGYQILPRDLGDVDVVLGVEPIEGGLIKTLALHSNYPNPFNPSTTLRFDVPADNNLNSPVTLTIFNSLGQKVLTLVNERLAAGSYKVEWNGSGANGVVATSGVYYAQLSMNGNVQTQKMMLVK